MIKNTITLSLVFTLLILVSSCKQENKAQESVNATTQGTHPAQKNNNKIKNKAAHLNTGGLEWMTFDEVAKHKNKEGKKYLVDVYTDWCGWCKVMDKKTFTDPQVQKYLDENFHVVKFDAEQKSPVMFKGKSYEFMGAGKKGINKLAIELLGSRMSYPTLVYLDEDLNLIKSIAGFKKPDQLLSDLRLISGS